jgi:hypothetical protein
LKTLKRVSLIIQNYMKYVGLTDDPATRKVSHGNPGDWCQRSFDSEKEARDWEEEMIDNPGYSRGTVGEGWRYGYTYSVTRYTLE